MLAGGFAAQHNRLLLQWDPVPLLIVASICLFAVPRTRALAVFGTGALLFILAAQSYANARLAPQFEGDSMRVVVRVIDFPKRDGDTVTMLVTPVSDARLPQRSRISWFQPPLDPALGDVWQFELRLRRPRGASNPGGFNTEAWMLREDLHAAGYVVGGQRNRLLSAGRPAGIDGIRYDIVRASRRTAAAGVLGAITTGSRHGLTRRQWDAFAATGTSHLMAISGLHVGLAAGVAFMSVWVLSVLLRLPGNALIHAAVGGAAVAGFYALVAGFGVPAQRATAMLALAAAAVVGRRQVPPLRILGAAALVVFLLDPVSSMSPGFHLSFAAVLALLWFSCRYWRTDNVGGRKALALRQLATMQVILLFGLMPLTILIFQRVSFAAPVVNLIAVPLFSTVTVPAALAGSVALAGVPGLSRIAFDVAAASIGWIEALIAAFADLGFSASIVAQPVGVVAAAAFLPLVWVVLPQGWPGRGVAVLAAALLVTNKPPAPPAGCLDAWVLDVGQGLSVFVQTHRHATLYDTGASYRSGGSAAQQTVIPFLRSRGIVQLDWLVVSHGDLDHAGGVADILGTMRVAKVLWNVPLNGAGTFRCRAGQSWQMDGVVFRVLHPDAGFVDSRNDGSCVIEVAVGTRRLLLTGDIEATAEQYLVDTKRLRSVDILTVPHHGSLTSSSPAFVNATDADVAIASAGYANRWGFPRSRVVMRWEGAGTRFLDTATSGAIRVRLCSWRRRSVVTEERQRRRRHWRGDTYR